MHHAPPVEHDTSAAHPSRPRRRLRPAHEVRMRRRRVIGYVLFAGAFTLMVNALVGESGYLATIRAERDAAAVQQDLAGVRLENQRLLHDIERLRTDPAALEEAARERLDMIKPGETLIILKDRSTQPDGRD